MSVEYTDIKPMRKGEIASILGISYYTLAQYIAKIDDFGECVAGFYTPKQIKRLFAHIDFDYTKTASKD